MSLLEGVENCGDVENKRRRHEADKCSNCPYCRLAAAGEHAQPNLDDVHHGEHQEDAAEHRAARRQQHAEAQHLDVDVGAEGLVYILTVEQIDG